MPVAAPKERRSIQLVWQCRINPRRRRWSRPSHHRWKSFQGNHLHHYASAIVRQRSRASPLRRMAGFPAPAARCNPEFPVRPMNHQPAVMKRLALAALTSGYLSPLVRPLVRGVDTILTLHRFSDPERGVAGQCSAALRADLAYLRKHKYQLLSVGDVIDRFVDRPANGSAAVAFTVDDGYYDWFQIAAPVFAEFDCPVTVFVATGFIDGQLWNWWDQVEHILDTTAHRSLRIDSDSGNWRYDWRSPDERRTASSQIVGRLERIPNERKLEFIEVMAASLEVE